MAKFVDFDALDRDLENCVQQHAASSAASAPSPGPAEDHGDCPNHDNLYCAIRQFDDEKFVQDLINQLVDIAKDPVQTERQTDRLKDILDRYQEQPQLVDPYLGAWVASLISHVKVFADAKSDENRKVANLSLTILRFLTKLRGYKMIIKYLPHHVSDVEQALSLIEDSQKSDTTAFEEWEQQYMLILWLSIAVQVPFDLKKLTDPDDLGTERSIEHRIFRVCQSFITVSEKTRDAAAYLLSRFLTRPDVLPHYGSIMVDWLLETMEDAQVEDVVKRPHVLCGCLAGIAEIFKSGTRAHLADLAMQCLPRFIQLNLLTSEYSMVRKSCMKALQRLGLIFLPSKLPVWRYQRGFRSLELNVTNGHASAGADDGEALIKENGAYDPVVEEEPEISDSVETVIGLLLQGLHDVDGIIRWSAAKGIGRICERLPRDFAEDVQNSVFQLFSYERSENAWHGGCLALAELSRRGALLPSRFCEGFWSKVEVLFAPLLLQFFVHLLVIPVVLKSLLYEELRGTYAVGSSVRDAACYVCWAFARAYEPRDLQKFVNDIAKHLVLTALFDRSVNCRRAASAAFQEHVGRQGNFPRGLDIIPLLDFESLGRRDNTYLKLSPQIALFPEYSTVILDFLVSHRLGHWDANVRELAARAMIPLCPLAPEYVAKKLVPLLLERLTSQNVSIRHGAVIGLGCVCEGLHKCGVFDQELASQVENVILKVDPKHFYRMLGEELLREAVMDLVSRASKAQLPFHQKYGLLVHMAQLVESNLTVENVKIQELAVSTLEDLMQTFGSCREPGTSESGTLQKRSFHTLMTNLSSSSDMVTRSSALALSIFPVSFAIEHLGTTVTALVTLCPRSRRSEPRWVDCRRNCCRSIDRLMQKVPTNAFSFDMFSTILDFLCECLADYTEDKRGNIGRIVRLTAIDSTKAIITRTARTHPDVLNPERMETVVRNLARLFGEGIPDIRAAAGQTLLSICSSDLLPDFPSKALLRSSFEKFSSTTINWISGASTYPIAMDLLSIAHLEPFVLHGLISSLGSLTESNVRESTAAFRKYFRGLSHDLSSMKSLAQCLAGAMRTTMKEERLVLPSLNALKQILASGVFYGNLDQVEPALVIDLLDVVQHIRLSQSTPKIVTLIEIYGEGLQFTEPVQGVALQRLLSFLSHVYPRVRVMAATKLHEGMMTCDDLVAENDTETLSTLLNETDWALSLEKSQEALKEIATLLHVHVKPLQLKVKVQK